MKCFEDVDYQTASDNTELTCRCMSLDPGEDGFFRFGKTKDESEGRG